MLIRPVSVFQLIISKNQLKFNNNNNYSILTYHVILNTRVVFEFVMELIIFRTKKNYCIFVCLFIVTIMVAN